MRAFLTCAILTVTTVAISATPAFAHPMPYVELVDSWYHRYLGRHVDPAGRHDHVQALRHGTPVDVVEAAILSSHEYYHRNGCTPEGYVAALYRDVLGRRASLAEFNQEVNCVIRHGCNAVALHLLRERAVVAATPVVVARPAPLIVTQPTVAQPVVVAPIFRPAPAVVAPPPEISIRIGIR